MNESTTELQNQAQIPLQPEKVVITVGKPRYFNLWGRCKVAGFSVIKLLIPAIWVIFYVGFRLDLVTMSPGLSLIFILIPLIVFPILMGCYIFFNENLWVPRIIRKMKVKNDKSKSCFTVEVILTPRAYKGLGLVLDDADDIGILKIQENCLEFVGDSIQIVIPYNLIKSLVFKRGYFATLCFRPKDIVISFDSETTYQSVEIFCREGATVPTALAASRRMIERLHRKMDDWMMNDAGVVPSKPSQPEHRFPLG